MGSEATVSGTVTVQAGRILGDRMVAIQDDSGGIFVRLPSAAFGTRLPRGTIVEASGVLAAPYGNLELRTRDVSDVVIVGSGGQPEAAEVASDGVTEANEGLLVVMRGTITGIDRRSRGALSLTIRDEKGSTRVFVHAALGIERSALSRGQSVRVAGLVGQRASRSGVADGYRIWPRGIADIEVLANDDPGATRPPGDRPPSRPPGNKRPRRVRIKNATPGSSVTIVGTVTSQAGFIDPEGRRVTVQDRSGAILVRYPADATPAAIGTVIRAWGEVDTWFGARQLEAAVKPKVKGRGRVAAMALRRLPSERDEWRLVSVTVRIEEIQREGDTWRAEGRLGAAGSVPIVGLAGSAISADALEEGRAAKIVGIVRRAHPSATDQRFAIAPRSAADIRLGRATRRVGGGTEDDGGADAPGGDDGVGSSAITVDLGSLATMTDVRVRVGGRLQQVNGRQLTLQDGSGRGTVRLHGDVQPIEPALRLGEIVNVAGRVRTRSSGVSEVVVRSATDVWRASALSAPPERLRPMSAAAGEAPALPPATGVSSDTQASPLSGWPMMLLVAVMTLVAVVTLGSAAMLVRRYGHGGPRGRHDEQPDIGSVVEAEPQAARADALDRPPR